MPRYYSVTLFNQHAGTRVVALGRTRKIAFNRAMAKAGEPWIRAGGDKATSLRVLFYDHLMSSYYRTSGHGYASDPRGAGVEFRRWPCREVALAMGI